MWVDTAGRAIESLATKMRSLLVRVGAELASETSVEQAATRLHEARRLDHEIVEVDASLVQAEESLRFNPRVREGALSRIVLRTGLDTLEICAVVVRTACRSLTDLAVARTDEPLFTKEISAALEELFTHIAGAVDSFGQLITTQVSTRAEAAEARLVTELSASRTDRDRVAHLLLAQVREYPGEWQLHGALLADIDRLLDELDVRKRSARLVEELDRYAREQHARYPRWNRLRRAVGIPRRRAL